MNKTNNLINTFKKQKAFKNEEIYSLIKAEQLNIPKSTVRWNTYKLKKEGLINKLDRNTFYFSNLKKYNYEFISEESKAIYKIIKKYFNNIDIAIWDEIILNEWLNLLINKNIIFIEVDKKYSENVFYKLNEYFQGRVLFNPSIKDILRYQRDNIIIVKNIVTRSPIDRKNKKILIEKLLIDMLFDKTISKLIDSNESYEMLDLIINKYSIDYSKLYNYAKRKHRFKEVKDLIDKN